MRGKNELRVIPGFGVEFALILRYVRISEIFMPKTPKDAGIIEGMGNGNQDGFCTALPRLLYGFTTAFPRF
ncbi:MAG: hypothetical protein RBR95_03690 [Ignavibacteriaceae bacterium]|jgi:hypothetical protein|nr:hypothetical protein [Ignavibacteriaceae bacterium]